MSITLTELRTRVKRRVAADLATPVINDLDDNSIDGWANEHTADVIKLLPSPEDTMRDLVTIDATATITSSQITFPNDYKRFLSLVVSADYTDDSGSTVTVTKRNVKPFYNVNEFKRFDGSNPTLTASGRYPVCLLADKIYLLPESGLNSAKLSYVKEHPTITTSQNILFNELGVNLLVLFILRRYYTFLEMFDMAETVSKELAEVVNYGNQ